MPERELQIPQEHHIDNMALWNEVCHTNPKHVKHVKFGKREFDTIQAQTQCKKATELWGPYGGRWGLRELKWFYVGPSDMPIELALEAYFEYPGGSFPISVDMRYGSDNDCRKKLMTEARSKALSWLGFNSDVFEGNWEDQRYVNEMGKQFAEQDFVKRAEVGIRSAKNAEKLAHIVEYIEKAFSESKPIALSEESYDGLMELANERTFGEGK